MVAVAYASAPYNQGAGADVPENGVWFGSSLGDNPWSDYTTDPFFSTYVQIQGWYDTDDGAHSSMVAADFEPIDLAADSTLFIQVRGHTPFGSQRFMTIYRTADGPVGTNPPTMSGHDLGTYIEDNGGAGVVIGYQPTLTDTERAMFAAGASVRFGTRDTDFSHPAHTPQFDVSTVQLEPAGPAVGVWKVKTVDGWVMVQ